ncbi:MAG TPA: hypothetical protein VIR54_04760 [Vicinamibacterales bacterium]
MNRDRFTSASIPGLLVLVPAFLASSWHATDETGASEELVRAVAATRLATDLRNGVFWRTVWTFLIANAHAIPLTNVGP